MNYQSHFYYGILLGYIINISTYIFDTSAHIFDISTKFFLSLFFSIPIPIHFILPRIYLIPLRTNIFETHLRDEIMRLFHTIFFS